MDTKYRPLPLSSLAEGASFRRPPQVLPESVTPDDPALNVMTDLERVAAVTVHPEADIANANDTMIANGVRLLLVVDEHNRVLGLVTAADILGESPMQQMQRLGVSRNELTVRDLMVPREQLDVLSMMDVVDARVGDIVETLRQTGRQHALVVDLDEPTGQQYVRGIFSATQVGRQLGVKVGSPEIARTFAELKAVLTSW